jgi:hypothetical protein
MAVFDSIEAWYNPHRRHSALDHRSPPTSKGDTPSRLRTERDYLSTERRQLHLNHR